MNTSLGTTAITLANNDRPFGAEQFYGNYNSWERTRTWFASARQDFGDQTQVAFAYRRHTDLFVLYRYQPELFTNRHAVDSYQGAVRRRESFGQNVKFYYGAEDYRDAIDSNNLGESRSNSRRPLPVSRRPCPPPLQLLGRPSRRNIRFLQPRIQSDGRSRLLAFPDRQTPSSVSRAFRLPTYTDLYYHDPANVGSPNLRPESAWSYEGGLDWNSSGRLRGAFTVFQRREHDGIDYVRSSPNDIWRATNFQHLQFTGVEASLTFRASNTQQIEWQYTGLHGAQDALSDQQSKYVFNYPVNSGVVSWQGAFPRGIIGRTRIGVLERYQRDPYALWEIYAASNRHRIRPFFQLSNITSTSYQEIPGVAMPGRSILGGFEFLVFAFSR